MGAEATEKRPKRAATRETTNSEERCQCWIRGGTGSGVQERNDIARMDHGHRNSTGKQREKPRPLGTKARKPIGGTNASTERRAASRAEHCRGWVHAAPMGTPGPSPSPEPVPLNQTGRVREERPLQKKPTTREKTLLLFSTSFKQRKQQQQWRERVSPQRWRTTSECIPTGTSKRAARGAGSRK